MDSVDPWLARASDAGCAIVVTLKIPESPKTQTMATSLTGGASVP